MGAMMALLVLAIIPIVVFYLTCQKHIIKGVAAGAVKGLKDKLFIKEKLAKTLCQLSI